MLPLLVGQTVLVLQAAARLQHILLVSAFTPIDVSASAS